MNCYVVVADPSLKTKLTQAFPDHHEVATNVWAVAGKQRTCADVCNALGIKTSAGKGDSGVVCKFNEYYGYFDRALWDKIASWQGS